MVQGKFDDEALRKIYFSMVSIDTQAVPKLVREAVGKGLDVLKIIEVLRHGITKVGDKFEAMECFLPELIMAANVMEESMLILRPEIDKLDLTVGLEGTVTIATVQGDIHDIGRNIVVAMLRASGFTVHDLGHDVKADEIVDKALEFETDIIGLSSLLTTSLPFAQEVVRLLETRDLRDRFKVVMGGGAVTPEYCKEIGADEYGEDAASAVKIMQKLISGR